MKEIATVNRDKALDVFTTKNGLDPYLEKIWREIAAFHPDASTPSGRKEIRSFAAKIARSKTYLDGLGKELVDELKRQPKLIDAERKRMRDTLNEWKAEVQRPLEEWKAEQEAIKLKKEIEASHEEALRLNDIFNRERDVARKEAEIAAQNAAERAERERAEREERIRQEGAQKAAQEAAREKAEAERKIAEQQLALERAEREKKENIERERRAAQEAIERAEREKEAAIKAAKRKAEREAREAEERRLAQELAEREAKAAREADELHREAVNRDAIYALAGKGIPVAVSRRVIELIAEGVIDHVSINY